MIEVPDPVEDDATEEEVEEKVEEESAEESAEEPIVEEEPKKQKQTLKDRVNCEACGKEVSLYCLRYSHKCKVLKTPKPPPLERTPKVTAGKGSTRPTISKQIIKRANYWRGREEEPDSPDFDLGDHLKQLHLYNREHACRQAAGPYAALFAH